MAIGVDYPESPPMTMSYLVRSAALEGFAELTRELSSDPEILLRRVKINPRFLQDPDHFISYPAMIRLLELAARETGCLQFGLTLSRKQELSMLGAIGLYAQSAPDVRSAIEALVKYVYLHAQGAKIAFNANGNRASFSFALDIPGLFQTRQIAELSIGIAYNVMRGFCGQTWTPDAVCFCHDGPRKDKLYRSIFNAPVRFNQEVNELQFDAACLDTAVSAADSSLQRYLGSYLESLETEHLDDPVAQVRQLIRTSLSTGACSIERVAELLSMNTRTLQRQLKDQGTNFGQLLEGVRIDLARQYLRDSSIPLTELAYILGYSELSAFSRAFRKWFGQSPKDWRKAAGNGV